MAKWIAALIVLFPLSVHQLDYRNRFSEGISFRLQRSSPAYAALEDTNEAYTEKLEHARYTEEVELKAGKIRIHSTPAEQPVHRILLSRLTIKQNFQPRAPLQSDMDLRIETPQAGLLPLEERKRILAQYFRKQDWSAPNVKDLAKQLVQEEVKSHPPNPDSRVIVGSETHTAIIVAKPGVDISGLLHGTARPPTAPPSRAPSNAPAVNTYASATPSFREPAIAMLADAGPAPKQDTDFPSLAVSSAGAQQHDPHILRGQLQMRDGLAFMGDETYFTLHRVKDGSIFETGRIWVSEARFEIFVKEPHGQLIAELHSRGGLMLGRGTLDIDSATEDGDPLRIELSPVTSGASAHVISGYSEGPRSIPVKNALAAMDQNAMPRPVSAENVIADPDRSHHSTYVVQAQASKHWPTLSSGVEGTQQDVRVYPESLVKSLLDLTIPNTQRTSADNYGVVWGRILKDGKPVSGVEVEMAGNYPAVYFNRLFLPDQSKTSTDSNGTFAFLMVRPGVQAVRIKYKDRVYPAQVFPADAHHVSYVEIHLEPNRSVNVALEDAFDVRKRMSAHVRFVGVEEEVEVDDLEKVHYPGGPDVMIMEADAGSDYELSRVQVLKNQSHVTVPLIRRDWLQTLLTIKQISLLPRRGTVVGFVIDQPFKVELTGYGSEIPQIVYFDQTGRIADGDSGPAGGGFVLFNAPLGLQTVQVKPLTSAEVFTQTFVAEPEFLHVFKYSFGESY